MKSISISKSAWHYKFASLTIKNGDEPQDLCAYVTQIIGSSVFVFFVILVCAIIGYVGGELLAWIVACFVSGSVIIGGPLILVSVSVLVFGVWAIVKGTTKAAEHSPQFVKEAYISFRDKVCYRINYRTPV